MADELEVKKGFSELVDQWLGPGGQEEEQQDALFDTAGRDARGRPIKPKVELSAVQKKLKRKIDEGKAPGAAPSRRAAEESDEEKEESRAGAIRKTMAPAMREQAEGAEGKKSKKQMKKAAAAATAAAAAAAPAPAPIADDDKEAEEEAVPAAVSAAGEGEAGAAVAPLSRSVRPAPSRHRQH